MFEVKNVTNKDIEVNIKIADDLLERKEMAQLALSNRLFVSGWNLNSELNLLRKNGDSHKIALLYIKGMLYPVAVVLLSKNSVKKIEIFVKKKYRRKGIGFTLAKTVIDHFKLKEFKYEFGIYGSEYFWTYIEDKNKSQYLHFDF